jgi:tRNA pseudouridine38-40 synthase
MRNIKIIISYDGTDFLGWQIQPGRRTVQDTLEAALLSVIGHRPFANASGRTDAGVHAVGQVVNFHTDNRLDPMVMARALNACLPDDVACLEGVEVTLDFDAKKHARRKLYRYVIHDGFARTPFMRRHSMRSRQPLDAAAMARASTCLVGRHDFRSFETDWPNRKTSVRTVTHLSVNRIGEYIWIDIEANGFLYNMVRSIAGTLINVGRGFWAEGRVEEILRAGDRRQAGHTAPPEGLYLVRVTYDDRVVPPVEASDDELS